MELEARDVPVTRFISVTSGADSGAGSLRQAYLDAVNPLDPAYDANTVITIDDSVSFISLNSPLIDDSINLTFLTITTEDDHSVLIVPDPFQACRFIENASPNGVTITLENLDIEYFYAETTLTDLGNGGAIEALCPLILNNCTFAHNYAEGD